MGPMPRPRRPARGGLSRNRIVGVVCAVIVVAVAVINFTVISNGGTTSVSSGAPAAAAPPPGVQAYPGEPRTHIEGDLTYDHNPPVGGNHNSVWQNCGVYDEPIRNENAVHSLEHGAVWVTYLPSLSTADVARLRRTVTAAYDGVQRYVLLSPYPTQASAVMAQAWGYQITLGGAADPRLATFIDYYREGPGAPERGAACSGGVGTPVA